MKREDARRRGPLRAKRPRRGAPPARTPPGRPAKNARGAVLPAAGALPPGCPRGFMRLSYYDSKDMGPVGNFATSSSIQVMTLQVDIEYDMRTTYHTVSV